MENPNLTVARSDLALAFAGFIRSGSASCFSTLLFSMLEFQSEIQGGSDALSREQLHLIVARMNGVAIDDILNRDN